MCDPLDRGDDDEGYFDNVLILLTEELDRKANEYIDEIDIKDEKFEKEVSLRNDLLDLFGKSLEHVDDDKKRGIRERYLRLF